MEVKAVAEKEVAYKQLKIQSVLTGWDIIINLNSFKKDTKINIFEMVNFLENESYNWRLFETGEIVWLESATENCYDNLEVVEVDTARKAVTLQVKTY